MNKNYTRLSLLLFAVLLAGCQTMPSTKSTKEKANETADKAMYQEIAYENAGIKGPTLVVIPGQIKSNNATFAQKVSTNNIADFGEMELYNANFKVLERADLGPLLEEISLAANLGDASALKKFRRGKFKSTKWFVKFDILKAEPVAEAGSTVDGATIGNLLTTFTGSQAAGTVAGSVKTSEEAKIWIIGMRYKVINAVTTEQVTSGYFEEKMEIGAKSVSVLGLTQSEKGGLTLDGMVQRLVQMAVYDLDSKKGAPPPTVAKKEAPAKKKQGHSRELVREMQTILASQGYSVGTPDGLSGPKTRAAISAFQKDSGLEENGRLNDQTIEALRAKAAEPKRSEVADSGAEPPAEAEVVAENGAAEAGADSK